MIKDLSDINRLLLRFGIYIYDQDVENRLELMKLELKQLFHYQLLSKQEYLEALTIIRSRQRR